MAFVLYVLVSLFAVFGPTLDAMCSVADFGLRGQRRARGRATSSSPRPWWRFFVVLNATTWRLTRNAEEQADEICASDPAKQELRQKLDKLVDSEGFKSEWLRSLRGDFRGALHRQRREARRRQRLPFLVGALRAAARVPRAHGRYRAAHRARVRHRHDAGLRPPRSRELHAGAEQGPGLCADRRVRRAGRGRLLHLAPLGCATRHPGVRRQHRVVSRGHRAACGGSSRRRSPARRRAASIRMSTSWCSASCWAWRRWRACSRGGCSARSPWIPAGLFAGALHTRRPAAGRAPAARCFVAAPVLRRRHRRLRPPAAFHAVARVRRVHGAFDHARARSCSASPWSAPCCSCTPRCRRAGRRCSSTSTAGSSSARRWSFRCS